ncbi:MAG: dihydroorotase [Mycoplasmataceae bacterium]|jgi:dihydroorotase|nr:dihydroorotase [Mycoplasmataceae bacterium]
MDLLIKQGNVLLNDVIKENYDILINDGRIIQIDKNIQANVNRTIDARNLTVLPGLIDVHVHLRQPGYEYKETIQTGAKAAAAGGYTTICCMPNTKPIIDDEQKLNILKNIIQSDAIINVLPYVSITINQAGKELIDITNLAKQCFAFSDDGVGVASQNIMKEAMLLCAKYHKPLVAHCEDLTQVGNAIEYKEVERDLKLALETNCQFHICHVSTKESITLIRDAKKQSNYISCEATPHHLLLCKKDIKDDGAYKMNPPLAEPQSVDALRKALIDGTIDMIATDHAPHSENEKNVSYERALNGIVGLDFAFSLLYTQLVTIKNPYSISLIKLVQLMSTNPAKRFNIDGGGSIRINAKANLMIVDLNQEWTINSKKFKSKGHSTPFDGQRVKSQNCYTVCNGRVVYDSKESL